MQAPVSELLPNTSYTFCLRAYREGEEALSTPVTFRTLPDAVATDTASTSVTLHAVLDPEGSPETYRFEYGQNTSYGSQTRPPQLAMIRSDLTCS